MYVIDHIKRHRKILAIGAVLLVALAALLCAVSYFAIRPYEKFVVSPQAAEPAEVGIVLGAGINRQNGQPYDELKARLDVAAEALRAGKVNKLLLSGDNRFHNYDEPTAMKRYLLDKGIAEDKLAVDYAGRSTYESCERASKVFGIKKTIIFSARSHLPRAIYPCKHFDVQAQGIASGLEANNSTRREMLARVKALYNIYILGERTVLGDPIPVHAETMDQNAASIRIVEKSGYARTTQHIGKFTAYELVG